MTGRFDDGTGTVHAYHRTWYDHLTPVMRCEDHCGRWIRVDGRKRVVVETRESVNCLTCLALP